MSKLRWAVALALLSTAAHAQSASESPVVPIGRFSDMRYHGEHCTGHTLDLWRRDARLLGVMRYCYGLADTLPKGSIDGSVAGKHVTFTTNLSTGSDYLGAGKQVPSQDHWKFAGTLSPTSLAGRITKQDLVYPGQTPGTSKLTLKREKKSLPRFADPAALARWIDDNP
jgi:hypothetical protein